MYFFNVFFAVAVADRSDGALPGVTTGIGFSASLERVVRRLSYLVMFYSGGFAGPASSRLLISYSFDALPNCSKV